MTAHDIIWLAFGQFGVTPTPALLKEYNAIMLEAVNRGYVHICKTVYRLQAWESVTLDADKQFALDDLTKHCVDVLKVADQKDYSSAAGFSQAREYVIDVPDRAHVIVVDAEPSATVWVQYKYLPALLVNPNPLNTDGAGSTSPDEMPEQEHSVLANKAAAAYWRSMNNYDRVDEFEGRFAAEVSRMTDLPSTTQRVIQNVYPY